MPNIVINILDLYLNKFLKVILVIKESLDHIRSIFSRNILDPPFGGFGLNKSAVCSFTTDLDVKNTVSPIKSKDKNIVIKIKAKLSANTTLTSSNPEE